MEDEEIYLVEFSTTIEHYEIDDDGEEFLVSSEFERNWELQDQDGKVIELLDELFDE